MQISLGNGSHFSKIRGEDPFYMRALQPAYLCRFHPCLPLLYFHCLGCLAGCAWGAWRPGDALPRYRGKKGLLRDSNKRGSCRTTRRPGRRGILRQLGCRCKDLGRFVQGISVLLPDCTCRGPVRPPCRLNVARARPGQSRCAGAGNPIRPRDTSDSHTPR
jgi:hypothetical protein